MSIETEVGAGTEPGTGVGATWHEVCDVTDLSPERGAAALLEGVQVALFRTHDDHVYAVQQLDPYSAANVMSRGIVGSRGDVPTVASPMYKQVFDLRTGKCLDAIGKEPQPLRSYAGDRPRRCRERRPAGARPLARCRMTTLVGLDVTGRRVVVAGGGPVAARRATALARDGAVVTVVAPQLCEDLLDAVADGQVSWVDREVEESDLAQAWLVHAATDDPGVNAQVAQWATARRVWSVCASDAELGTARTPATTEHAGLLVGVVSTGQPDPQRATRVRDQLEWSLQSGDIDLRARRRTEGGAQGRVVLVGGGPGAADLMTLRARRVLSQADVVVTDRLGPTSVLADLPDDVEVVDVGKTPGLHAVTQDEINRILVDHAQRGRLVVRLKGGDPFLFGRGGEEELALAAHGIPVEVVPGVSSALSAPAAAGIPVTHRGTVAAVHVAHGHGRLDDTAVGAVVRGEATLVVLMGISLLADHVARLLSAGASGRPGGGRGRGRQPAHPARHPGHPVGDRGHLRRPGRPRSRSGRRGRRGCARASSAAPSWRLPAWVR